MKYLEDLDNGWWKTHEEHKSHYIRWFIIAKQASKVAKRNGFLDYEEKLLGQAADAKRNLQRVLVTK